jgi:Na+/H+-dicarboxylate symporter
MIFINYCREKMLALIIFSFLIGFASLRSGEKELAFRISKFRDEVMKQLRT